MSWTASWTTILTVTMLLTGGLFTGGVAWYAWDRVAIWRTVSLPEFASDFRRSIGRADPAQPILALLCLVSAIGFGLSTTEAPRLLAWAAAGGLALNIVASLAMLVPAQYHFVRQPEGQLPQNALALRRRWLRGHLVRTGVVVASFVLLALAVVVR
jgi:hypothetical protein